jgi:hypothetical protein
VETGQLSENLCSGVELETWITHRGGNPADHLPVRHGLAGRGHRRPAVGKRAFAVDHHPVGLGPQRGGQHHVGVLGGLDAGERILDHHQLAEAVSRITTRF